MKLFEVKTDLTSFTYPAVKITICLLVILFSIAQNRIFHFLSAWVNAVVTILCFALAISRSGIYSTVTSTLATLF